MSVNLNRHSDITGYPCVCFYVKHEIAKKCCAYLLALLDILLISICGLQCREDVSIESAV